MNACENKKYNIYCHFMHGNLQKLILFRKVKSLKAIEVYFLILSNLKKVQMTHLSTRPNHQRLNTKSNVGKPQYTSLVAAKNCQETILHNGGKPSKQEKLQLQRTMSRLC